MKIGPDLDLESGFYRRAIIPLLLFSVECIAVFALIVGDKGMATNKITHPPESLCFAFLEGDNQANADLFLRCNARKDQITRFKDIWDFAIASDGNSLALLRGRGANSDSQDPKKGDTSRAAVESKVEIISLSAGFERRWSGLKVGGH